MKCNNILEAVGHTPLIRLNRINAALKPQIYVKAEYANPGGSVKDRIGITMIDDAEKKGLLKPGGTIIEGTSGNTGMGLALVAAVRGYKMVFTITDKQSKGKVDLLKALGAGVIVCPTAVEPVKQTLSTPGWTASAAPTVGPNPVSIFTIPGGRPASRISRPRLRALRGVSSDGFKMQAQPAANAGASFWQAMRMGPFHGMISAATPTGSRSV